MQEHIDATDIVSRAVDRITRRGKYADLELSNGIVLTLRPVPPLLLSAVVEEFKDPEPPLVFLEEKGRNEPNPNDPEYVKELARIAKSREEALNKLILATGSSVKHIPEGYYGPNDEEWVEQVKFAQGLLGISVHLEEEDRTKRYINWLQFYALESTADVFLAQNVSLQLAGLREGEVEEVFESFQRLPERRADLVSGPETGSENGDRDNGSRPRGRPRTRGT